MRKQFFQFGVMTSDGPFSWTTQTALLILVLDLSLQYPSGWFYLYLTGLGSFHKKGPHALGICWTTMSHPGGRSLKHDCSFFIGKKKWFWMNCQNRTNSKKIRAFKKKFNENRLNHFSNQNKDPGHTLERILFPNEPVQNPYFSPTRPIVFKT